MKNVRALVTGSSGDIGGAICRRLAADGIEVIAHANQRKKELEDICAQISKAGGTARAISFDVTDKEAVSGVIESLLSEGPIQVLVSNAGIHDDAPLAGMRPDQWKRVIDVSLNGFYNVCQPILLPMIRTRWGRIVAVSSVAGIIGNRGQANYAAAKSGLHGACKSLSLEIASRGVTVNVVAPGIIEGGLTAEIFNGETIERMVPMKRAGKPQEIASLVSYLCSEESSYISGQVISVNGGMV